MIAHPLEMGISRTAADGIVEICLSCCKEPTDVVTGQYKSTRSVYRFLDSDTVEYNAWSSLAGSKEQLDQTLFYKRM